MFIQKPTNKSNVQPNFHLINQSTKLDEIRKLAIQSRATNNLYGFAQCIFELYRKSLWSWNTFKVDSKSYAGNSSVSGSLISLDQDRAASYFISILDDHDKELSQHLSDSSKEFFDNFYKKHSQLPEHKVNSFFNLINYISNNMGELHPGFNNIAAISFAHNRSVQETKNTENVYINNLEANSQLTIKI